MPIAIAQWVVLAVGLYALLGMLFAIPFVLRGANVIDPSAQGGTWGFRLLILPGVVALWPFLAQRWLRRRQAPEECNPHRLASRPGAR